MIVLEGPAMLGSLLICVALGAWALGRCQGAVLAAPVDAAPAPQALPPRATPARPTTCQDVARDERRAALATAPSLDELHAEITAYRRTQQVFADLDAEVLLVVPLPGESEDACLFLGLTGQPTCGAAAAARTACANALPCAKAGAASRDQARAVQPFGAMRV